MRVTPQFTASPAPSEQEAAAIAAAIVSLLDSEAAAAAAAFAASRAQESRSAVSGWVADGRLEAANRGAFEARHLLPQARAWRISGRARVWGTPTVQRH